ncbi:TolC family protein [Magnetococcales bacterium HHB-1]
MFLLPSYGWSKGKDTPITPSTLTLAEVEKAATADDPAYARLQAQQKGLQALAIARGELPDPRLKLGLVGLPLDTFENDQEPMTQWQIGVQQRFPKGQTLALQTEKTERVVEEKRWQEKLQQRKNLRAVRLYYLEAYYNWQAQQILKKSLHLFRQLVKIAETHYASGMGSQQDIARAQLEVSKLKERSLRLRQKEQSFRAKLSEWIQERAFHPLSKTAPDFDATPKHAQSIVEKLPLHPMVQIIDARIRQQESSKKIAKEQYKPGWMVDVTYGARGGQNMNRTRRTDLLSAMVMIDIPLFTENRQDKRLAASQSAQQAMQFARDDQLQTMRSQIEELYQNLLVIQQIDKVYKTRLTQDARLNTNAALLGYQSGTTDFAPLMRGRLTELEIQLAKLRLAMDTQKVYAKIRFFSGEKE